MNPHSQDPLDALLKQKQPHVTLPARFQSEVWQRIADRETTSPWAPLQAWLNEWAAVLTRPRYASALLAVVIVVSAGLAQLQSVASERETGAALQARYLNSIDPYSKSHQ